MSGIINSDADQPTVREAAIALIRAIDRHPDRGVLIGEVGERLGDLRAAADLEERSIVAKLPNANWAREGIAKMIAQAPANEVTAVHIRAIVEAAQVGLDANRSFAVRWAADQRAIKRWQAGDELAHCGELRPLLGEVTAFLRQMDDVHANAMGDRLDDALHEAKPGNRSTTWPDHADLVVWLLGRLVDWERIQGLRDEEADVVSILCENPDADEHHPAFAIECNGFWTGFADRRFEGRTLSEAIELATIAKGDARVAGYPDLAIEAAMTPPVSAARFRRALAAMKRGMGAGGAEFEAVAIDQLDALELLGEAATLFREYEAHHLAKLGPRMAIVEADVSAQSVAASQAAVEDIRAKAERNAAMAAKIEAFLAPADQPDLVASPTGADALAYGLSAIGGKNTADYDRRQLEERINDALSSYDPTADDGELGVVVAEHAPGWEWQRLDQLGQSPQIVLVRYAPDEPL